VPDTVLIGGGDVDEAEDPQDDDQSAQIRRRYYLPVLTESPDCEDLIVDRAVCVKEAPISVVVEMSRDRRSPSDGSSSLPPSLSRRI
jgi:hypothetical protein